MIFNSITFLIFLAIVVLLYWHLPRRPRLYLILCASAVFYGFWSFAFVPLLFVSVTIDYLAALAIERSRDPRARRALVAISVTANLGLLGFFKYYYFLGDNLIGLASLAGVEITLPALDIVLPIGISFYTFQSISYTIDVYRGFIRAERDYILFADYVIFFPQLVAGPILRAREILWQLAERPAFDRNYIALGARRILGGLFLKVVLVDNLGRTVDYAYAEPASSLSALDTLTMAFLFGFQIYFDFAAYSHIALGAALLMGIRFPENFNFPYQADSPREFWRRWHITLSSWIRDYLYLPLAGAQVEDRSTGGLSRATEPAARIGGHGMVALLATWVLMGLWHGAGWAFVLWGMWHAGLIAVYRLSMPARQRLPLPLRRIGGWLWTLPMVMLAWIPFRSQSLEDTAILWGHLLDPARWTFLGLRENTYLLAAVVAGLTLLAPYTWARAQRLAFCKRGLFAAGEVLALTVTAALVFVYLRPVRQFIYFQF
jgi:alginate O-acetyltransferase complex protein AlgI